MLLGFLVSLFDVLLLNRRFHVVLANLKLQTVVDVNIAYKASQDGGSLLGVDETFVEDVVVSPETRKIVTQVELTLVAGPAEVGSDHFSSDLLHALGSQVEMAVGVVVGVSLDSVLHNQGPHQLVVSLLTVDLGHFSDVERCFIVVQRESIGDLGLRWLLVGQRWLLSPWLDLRIRSEL